MGEESVTEGEKIFGFFFCVFLLFLRRGKLFRVPLDLPDKYSYKYYKLKDYGKLQKN